MGWNRKFSRRKFVQTATATGLVVATAQIEPIRRFWRGHSFAAESIFVPYGDMGFKMTGDFSVAAPDGPVHFGEMSFAFDDGVYMQSGDVLYVRYREPDEKSWSAMIQPDGTLLLGDTLLGENVRVGEG